MVKTFVATFSLLLCFCLQAQGPAFQASTYVDEHLSEYADINPNHHDNVDDEGHSHSHKHSENGEEHEHHHGHKKPSSQETQFFSSYDRLGPVLFGNISRNEFREASFQSDSYPDELFRPPIA